MMNSFYKNNVRHELKPYVNGSSLLNGISLVQNVVSDTTVGMQTSFSIHKNNKIPTLFNEGLNNNVEND